jgi:hypothetical protein
MLATPPLIHRIDLLLTLTIVCLAVMILRREEGGKETAVPVLALPPGGGDFGVAIPRTDGLAVTPVSYAGRLTTSAKWLYTQPFNHLPSKSAVRLVELSDAFIVSLSVRNLESNSVQLKLAGSLLTIITSHGQLDNTVTLFNNNIMLPAVVDAGVAPTYSLTNDLLEIRVCKPGAIR